MDHGVFSEISLIVAIGSVVGLIMHIFKQPLIVGHIITGIVAGPLVFDIVHAEDTVEVFARIGIALLLFIIGLGLNPKFIKEIGKVSTYAAGFQVVMSFIIGYVISLLFGLSGQASLVIGVVIAFSSTIIILKLLSDNKEQNRLHGKLAVGLLLIQDIFATAALLVIAATGGGSFTLNDGITLIGKGLLLGGLLVIMAIYILPKFKKLISESQEILFLLALGWGLGVPALFELAGFSFEIGALAAGVSLASQNYALEISSKLKPLRDFFIVLFFVELGTTLNFAGIGENFAMILILLFVVVVINPLLAMGAVSYFGYTKKTSFMTGITMSQISEFSLIFAILANENGFIDDNLVSALTFLALLSIAASTYLINYSGAIYDKIHNRIKLFDDKVTHEENANSEKYDAIIFGYKKGGSEFAKTFKRMNKRFIVVDYDPHVIDKLDHESVDYQYGDVTDTELLDEIGIDQVKIIVGTFTDHAASKFLVSHIHEVNSSAIIVLHADNPEEAEELYLAGATYVMLPHYIGSEKLSSFISRHGFKKSEFTKWRDKHLSKLQDTV